MPPNDLAQDWHEELREQLDEADTQISTTDADARRMRGGGAGFSFPAQRRALEAAVTAATSLRQKQSAAEILLAGKTFIPPPPFRAEEFLHELAHG